MGAGQGRIVGYYGSWSAYREGRGQCRIEDINANLCTHYIWSFLKIEDNKVAFNDDGDERNLRKFVRHIRSENSNAKVMAAIGGWTHSQGSEFSDMVFSMPNRQRFITSVVKLMEKYDLNGIDIDWEFPGQEHRDYFVRLLQELYEACCKKGKELSVAVAGSTITANKAYDIAKISDNVDFVNLMAYDLNGHWDDYTKHHAGWWGSGYVRAIVLYWINEGCPKSKLIVGIPCYGRTWTLKDSGRHGVGNNSSGPGDPGEYTNEAGTLAYFEILEKFQDENWHERFDSEVKSPYAYRGDQWISYENVRSAEIKAQYIKDEGLGGAMFWSLDMDDFDGNYGRTFPLVRAVRDILKG